LFIAAAIAIAIALTCVGGVWWLANALAAAFGSYCAAIGSFIVYRSAILRATAQSDGVLSAIDDRLELYEEDAPLTGDLAEANETKGDPTEEEKSPETTFATKAAFAAKSFSPIRALGYLPLILGFFALHTNGGFMPAPFLIALASLPIAALLFAALSGTRIAKKDKSQEGSRCENTF
jgi:hypothetical protein